MKSQRPKGPEAAIQTKLRSRVFQKEGTAGAKARRPVHLPLRDQPDASQDPGFLQHAERRR